MPDLKELASKRTAVIWLDPKILKIEQGLNARDLDSPEAKAHIDWLANSIAESGVKKPLEVFSKKGEVYVSDGHCRLLAVLRCLDLGVSITSIPCVQEPRGVNDADRILNQNLSNSGLRLTALEEGHNIKRAVALGLSVSDIARKLSKSVSYVSQALDFQAAPAEIHNMVKAGEASPTLAAQVFRAEGEQAPKILKAAVETAKAEGRKKVRPRDLPTSVKSSECFGSVIFNFKQATLRPSTHEKELAVTVKGVVLVSRYRDWADLAWSILDVVDKKESA
jgi:ParB family transcriptional regulator, chromosome partitioning protein